MLIRSGRGNFGFSTALLGSSRGRGATIVQTARALDLNIVEIDANLDCESPEVLAPLLRREGVRVAALRNAVSAGGGEERYRHGATLADPRPAEAEISFRLTRETARAARLLGASFVILRGGPLPGEELRELEGDLVRLFAEEGLSDGVRKLLERGRALAEPLLESALDRLIRALFALLKAEESVVFCLETGSGAFELPGLTELEYILEDLANPRLLYWHDTGRAHAREALGLVPHEAWLDRFGGRIAGVRLHDASGLDGHLPPGAGEIDFRRVREALPDAACRILDLAPGQGLDAARMGVAEIRKIGI